MRTCRRWMYSTVGSSGGMTSLTCRDPWDRALTLLHEASAVQIIDQMICEKSVVRRGGKNAVHV